MASTILPVFASNKTAAVALPMSNHYRRKAESLGSHPSILALPLWQPYFGTNDCLNRNEIVLRKALVPLLQQSNVGFPLAILRSSLIEETPQQPSSKTSTQDADLSYDALEAKYQLKAPASWPKLLSKTIQSEADAYLASHIIALEEALISPDTIAKWENRRTLLPIKKGIEDAHALTDGHNAKLYGKKRKLVDDSLYQLILESPKVALHEHQRGAAPIALVRSRFMNEQDSRAYLSNGDLQNECRVERLYTPSGKGPLYKPGLPKFLEKYNLVAKNTIKNVKTAYLAAYLYTLTVAQENVRYFEYRFNPMTGADPLHYASVVQQGIDDARAFLLKNRHQNIDANMIFSAYRMNLDYDFVKAQPEQARADRVKAAMAVLQTAIRARQEGLRVTGYDIAGDEENFAITDYATIGAALRKYNQAVPLEKRIGATIHAGETPVSGVMSHPGNTLTGAQSVRKAIEIFWDRRTPLRIGHGVQAIHDPQLLEFCLRNHIGFEQCPKSNIQTGAVGFYPELPTLDMLKQGLLVSLSTDNRTLSKTTNTNELVKVSRYLGAVQNDRKHFELNGIRTAFIFNRQQKQAITNDMQQIYKILESMPVNRRIMRLEKYCLPQLIGEIIPATATSQKAQCV